jgi:hypothetical protein
MLRSRELSVNRWKLWGWRLEEAQISTRRIPHPGGVRCVKYVNAGVRAAARSKIAREELTKSAFLQSLPCVTPARATFAARATASGGVRDSKELVIRSRALFPVLPRRDRFLPARRVGGGCPRGAAADWRLRLVDDPVPDRIINFFFDF